MSESAEVVAAHAPVPLLDVTTLEARRRTLRMLLKVFLGLLVASLIAEGVFTLPESMQLAQDMELEMVPQWRFAVGIAVSLVVLGASLWGLYQLWHYRRAGLWWFVLPVAFPSFLLINTPSVYTAISDYLNGLVYVCVGAVLLLCLAMPDVLSDSVTPPESSK
jgi:hypothetical protein